MEESQAIQKADALLKLPPVEIVSWLQSVWDQEEQVPEDFNWLGLAEVASTRASLRGELAWSEVAVLIYEWLAIRTQSENTRDSELSSAMSLRAGAIRRHGVISGHHVLDPERVISWFYAGLIWSYEEVKQKVEVWKTLPLEEIRRLREIKIRLKVVRWLVECGAIEPDQQLSEWLAIATQLP